jgi:hypothetical protein
MLYPFFENTRKTLQYGLLWVVYALVQALVFAWIVPVSFWTLLADGFIHAAIFAALGVLLWTVLKFGNFQVLTVYQRLMNHFALALLCISVWLSSGYGLFYVLFDVNTAAVFIPFLPIRGLLGLLIYVQISQQFMIALHQLEEPVFGLQEEVAKDETAIAKVTQTEVLERIAVKSGSKIHVILVPEVIFLQADGDYVQIITAQGKYLKEQTMKSFEEQLPENQFVRVHRSVIVNVEMISRIELYEKQNQLLTLKNGQQIKTSPSGYKALRMALNL